MIITEQGGSGTSGTTSTVYKPAGTGTTTNLSTQYQQEVEALKKKMGNWAGEPKNQAAYNPWYPQTSYGASGVSFNPMLSAQNMVPAGWGPFSYGASGYSYAPYAQPAPEWATKNFAIKMTGDKNRDRGTNRNYRANSYFHPTTPQPYIPPSNGAVAFTPPAPAGNGGGGFGSAYPGWGNGGGYSGGGGGGGFGGYGWDWNLINWNVR